MVFKIDTIDGRTISWRKEDGKALAEKHPNYFPRFYINGDRRELQKARTWLTQHRGVATTSFEEWKPTLSKPKQFVLRVDCISEDQLKTVVNMFKKHFGRRKFRYYNVGFSPQFRFCLQEKVDPRPAEDLTRAEIKLHRKRISNGNLNGLQLDDRVFRGETSDVLEDFVDAWEDCDPDLVIVNRGSIMDLIRKKIHESDLDYSLGRMGGVQELAGENTVSSYGQTQHSAARYNLPGRILIDRSNSFMLGEATLEGLWDLVGRSYRPMQELAWGSIGRLLTSIEVKKAYLEEETLTPWKNWEGERPKDALTLHKADRGGFIFNPEPSIHRDVYKADFASLFPNIMVKKNISPETVCCNCCSNNNTPELGYSICQEKNGFIGKVLEPLISDRQEMKERVDDIEKEEERRYVRGSIDAIKWILVSCFGYMGHSHASYGAIKCHQAIQAYDREIMLQAKNSFEESGYSIAHGIIDSIWVQEKEDAEEFEEVCSQISEEVGIKLEPEYKFEWCAFVPRSSSDATVATLNRYFGKKKNGEFKTAGIEVEQSSASDYISESQMQMIKELDRDMNPQDVINVLEQQIDKLEAGDVDASRLEIKKRASKSLKQYSVENRTVAALKRCRKHGIQMKPGQSVTYVVRDDDAPALDRVRLDFESIDKYDPDFYRTQLIRACESILSPLGFDREDIREELENNEKRTLKSFY